MIENNFITEIKNPESKEISTFFALLAIFWIYPLVRRTVIFEYLTPSGVEHQIIFAALCVGAVFGLFAFKKDIYPFLLNTFVLLVYSLFIQSRGKPQPTYVIILALSGFLLFFPIAWNKIATNLNTKEELYYNISKYLFFLSLIIQALGSILSYQTQPGDAMILTLIVSISGVVFGVKSKKINRLWLIFNMFYFIGNMATVFFDMPIDVLFRFLQ